MKQNKCLERWWAGRQNGLVGQRSLCNLTVDQWSHVGGNMCYFTLYLVLFIHEILFMALCCGACCLVLYLNEADSNCCFHGLKRCEYVVITKTRQEVVNVEKVYRQSASEFRRWNKMRRMLLCINVVLPATYVIRRWWWYIFLLCISTSLHSAFPVCLFFFYYRSLL